MHTAPRLWEGEGREGLLTAWTQAAAAGLLLDTGFAVLGEVRTWVGAGVALPSSCLDAILWSHRGEVLGGGISAGATCL